jgi:Uma2 family endonuclease
MTAPSRQPERKYTYQDYLNRTVDERYELIDGVPYAMSPAPSRKHQEITGELFEEFRNYLMHKDCRAYPAPFDVRFTINNEEENSEINVVQPDITVVCDKDKLDERGCKGAPDLIVEVISPSTGKQDRWLKYKLYEKVGVKEYWIIDPMNELVDVFVLEESKTYQLNGSYGKGDSIKVGIFEDLIIDLSTVFRDF